MENESSTEKPQSMKAFEEKVAQTVHDTRGLIGILKSVKGLEKEGKESQLYRITLKRFRDNCLTLAAYAEACSLILGDEERDRLLRKHGCGWDSGKRRVTL